MTLSGQFQPGHFTPREIVHHYPQQQESQWAPDPLQKHRRREKLLPLTRIEALVLSHSAHSLVTVPSDLARLNV